MDEADIGVLGDGALYEAVAAAAGTRFRVTRLGAGTVPADRDRFVALVVVGDPAAGWLAEVRGACAQAATPWLAVRAERDEVIIGPVTVEGRPGCATCVSQRRRAHTGEHPAPPRSDAASPTTTPTPLLTALAAGTAAGLVAGELVKLTGDRADGDGSHLSFLRLDLRRLGVGRHRFLPDPACPDCGGLPDDRPQPHLGLRSRAKPDPAVFRVRDLASRERDLLDTYVDERAGLIRELRMERDAPLPRAVAVVADKHGNGSEHGWGRATDFRSCALIAVLEALERFGGRRPGGGRTVVRGSYRELAAQALNPRQLGLHPDERHAEADFPFQRYNDDLVISWVWGYSFGRRAAVLVPQHYAYYGLHTPDERRFVYEISNGCALGSCPEEAILHGLLEVAERDAFLMTWYARLPVPRIDPESAHDRAIPLLIEHLRQTTGYDVLVFSTTLEQRVPCFWAMAVDRVGAPDRPATLCAGGSAIRPERGVLNALHELAHLLASVQTYDAAQQERAASMVENPALVRAMGDHSLLYSHPAASGRFDFLLSGRERRTFGDLAEVWSWPRTDDLRADLDELVGRYLDGSLDVVVVDQTTPEHRAGGLTCVKVIVPGTLPMTFGHHARRTHGIPRLFSVPRALGYRDRPLTPADVNPHPHPFP